VESAPDFLPARFSDATAICSALGILAELCWRHTDDRAELPAWPLCAAVTASDAPSAEAVGRLRYTYAMDNRILDALRNAPSLDL
jgi:hypothetical protein